MDNWYIMTDNWFHDVCVFSAGKTIAVLIPEPTGCKTLKTAEKRRGELTVVNINNLEMHWFYAHGVTRSRRHVFKRSAMCQAAPRPTIFSPKNFTCPSS